MTFHTELLPPSRLRHLISSGSLRCTGVLSCFLAQDTVICLHPATALLTPAQRGFHSQGRWALLRIYFQHLIIAPPHALQATIIHMNNISCRLRERERKKKKMGEKRGIAISTAPGTWLHLVWSHHCCLELECMSSALLAASGDLFHRQPLEMLTCLSCYVLYNLKHNGRTLFNDTLGFHPLIEGKVGECLFANRCL